MSVSQVSRADWSLCSVQADHKAEQSESDQVADIELGEPQQDEPAAATIIAEKSTSNDTKMEDVPSAAAVHGNGESSTANGKRPSQQDTADKDKPLPPSKRTRTAPGGAQRRLFGVLTKTLSKFQEETKKDTEAVSLDKMQFYMRLFVETGRQVYPRNLDHKH